MHIYGSMVCVMSKLALKFAVKINMQLVVCYGLQMLEKQKPSYFS